MLYAMRDTPGAEEAGEAVAAEIRAELARQRRTQSALADRLGVSHAWVSRRLSGEVPLTIADVAQIAAGLGVEISSLTVNL
jgi:transcriptional regulator with XRE-family HTH domain